MGVFYNLVFKSLENINVIYSIRMYYVYLNVIFKLNLDMMLNFGFKIIRYGGIY